MEEETVEESPINGFSRLFVLESPLYWVFSWIYVSYFHPVRIPVCSILFPLLASFAAVVIYLVMAANAAWKAVSSRGKHYEYIKSFWKYSDADEPVLTLHEIDLNAGRNGMRCIEIYKDGHAECLENKGVYAPVPTVESINVLPNYTAYIIMKQEFEEIWNR